MSMSITRQFDLKEGDHLKWEIQAKESKFFVVVTAINSPEYVKRFSLQRPFFNRWYNTYYQAMGSDLYHLSTQSIIPFLQIVGVSCAIAGLGLIVYGFLRKSKREKIERQKKNKTIKTKDQQQSKEIEHSEQKTLTIKNV
jgi:hypothetical protein